MMVDEIKERLVKFYGVQDEDVRIRKKSYDKYKTYILAKVDSSEDNLIYLFKFEIQSTYSKILDVDYKTYSICDIYNSIDLRSRKPSSLGKYEKFASSFVGKKFDK